MTARAKEVSSFVAKAAKCEADGRRKYSEPFDEIYDMLAARITVFTPAAVEQVCAVVRAEFDVHEEIDKGKERRARGEFGYASTHFTVRLAPDRGTLPEYRPLVNCIFEIQVRTVVQHAWAEFEHDVRYKVDIPVEQKPQLDRHFILAAALLEMADKEFDEIDQLFRSIARDAPATTREGSAPAPSSSGQDAPAHAAALTHRSQPQGVPAPALSDAPQTTPLDAATLRAYLANRYPGAPTSKAEHYQWIAQGLTDCEVYTLERLDLTLASIDSAAVEDAMGNRLPAGHVRRLDDDLLVALGERWVEVSAVGSTAGASRPDLLNRRAAKLRKAGLID